MPVYLYHPGYFAAASRVAHLTEPIHKRLFEEQCTMPAEEWSALYEKVSRIDAKVQRGYYMQWCSLLQKVTGVWRPEFDFKKFSFREMRKTRSRLRQLLRNGLAPYENYCLLESGFSIGRLTFECWTNTLRWALGIFTRGLRDNRQVYLA